MILDIDECALGLHDCGRESTCVNTVGAYKCRCLNPNYPMMIDGFCQGLLLFQLFLLLKSIQTKL